MAEGTRADIVRRDDRATVLEHLLRDARGNLLLLDMAARVGGRASPGELR